VSIAYTPRDVERHPRDRYARVAVDRVTLVADRGIEGDAKANGGKRQLNVMFAETVVRLAGEGLATKPGELGEQLVIAGLNELTLGPGARIWIGASAVLELGKLRTPCERFAHIQNTPIEQVIGRIGYMARVLEGGEIAVGSPVEVEKVASPVPSP
ncbi:MAG TPA: MOSC domain-containing protein, partial [Lacipirellula sp.]